MFRKLFYTHIHKITYFFFDKCKSQTQNSKFRDIKGEFLTNLDGKVSR